MEEIATKSHRESFTVGGKLDEFPPSLQGMLKEQLLKTQEQGLEQERRKIPPQRARYHSSHRRIPPSPSDPDGSDQRLESKAGHVCSYNLDCSQD